MYNLLHTFQYTVSCVPMCKFYAFVGIQLLERFSTGSDQFVDVSVKVRNLLQALNACHKNLCCNNHFWAWRTVVRKKSASDTDCGDSEITGINPA